MEAVTALNKSVPNVPGYDDGFVRQFLCQDSTMDCWLSKCTECHGVSIEKLKDAVGTQSSSNVSWVVWKKNKDTKRVEKLKENGQVGDLIAHISAIAPQFLRHSFIKREQSESFNLHDVPRASGLEFCLEAVLQIDFAENFLCEAQDEVQSAHWNQPQLTLFTSGMYYNDNFQAKVFVSNNLTHTKETGIQIIWNYFATSHGKGCVDGIGATVKCIVRNHVKARDCIVNTAADFIAAFKRTESTIQLEEVTEDEFITINNDLSSTVVYNNAKNIRDISSAHQIKIINGKVLLYATSKLGYN